MSGFKGVPMNKVYRGGAQWDSIHLPPIQNQRNHFVLFHLPIAHDSKLPPTPQRGEMKWDSHHVRLPCATQNDYKTESASDPTKVIKTTRWEIIQTALLQDIQNSRELEQRILTYNTKYAKEWKFKSLHALFEQELDYSESESFFRKTLPDIIALALQLPHLVPSSIPLLKKGNNKSISLSQQQIACILANAFLCTFPRRNDNSRNSEYSSYPSINFNGLFQTPGDQNMEKIKCICNYFRRVCSRTPTGVVTFTRRSVNPASLPQWDECDTTFADSLLHVSEDGTIEDDGEGLLQVDFANKFLGGGVLNYGCVQEEIRFMICPELLCSRLFTEVLGDNECLLIMGCERFNHYRGYASTFEWTGDCMDKTPFDDSKRRKCTIVAIDAIHFSSRSAQYTEEMIQRELNKAYVGFKHDLTTPAPAVATGNWGCGVFNGDKHLKSLIQLIACCITKRPLVYYTFGDEALRDELFVIYEYLTTNKVKISDVWSCLLEYAHKKPRMRLFEFIMQHLMDPNEPSTNGQCSKANRSDAKISPKPKLMSKTKPKTTTKRELKSTKSDDDLNAILDDLETKQYTIEDSDDQYSENETMELLKKSEREHGLSKPSPARDDFKSAEKDRSNRSIGNRSIDNSSVENRPAKVITTFFEQTPSKTNEKNEIKDKRPRSLLVDSLDADFVRKSPAKQQRCSSTPKLIASTDKIIDLEPDCPETNCAVVLEDDEKVVEKKVNDDSVYEMVDESTYKDSRDSNQHESTAMSEEMFDDDDENDNEVVSDQRMNKSNIDQEKSKSDTPLKGIDRQRAKFKSYFTPNKRSNSSTLGNANKKSADNLNESSTSNQDKSPNSSVVSATSEEWVNSTANQTPSNDSTEEDQDDQMDVESLLTEDESDIEVKTETNHMKSLNVTSEKN